MKERTGASSNQTSWGSNRIHGFSKRAGAKLGFPVLQWESYEASYLSNFLVHSVGIDVFFCMNSNNMSWGGKELNWLAALIDRFFTYRFGDLAVSSFKIKDPGGPNCIFVFDAEQVIIAVAAVGRHIEKRRWRH
uniref:Uncharacterized protein n=1 Tax=Nelumbo nucifera TaxID=4432 RepID=A0A822YVB6_NELNU|nr:TPA_asm: hypothetical protein HUJ06_007263 [Nelumbo nucifera]